MISIIVAMDKNRVIGKSGGDMPWGRALKDDLKRFKELTTGHIVIMGRKTFETLGNRPLPNRTNVILTRNANYRAEGCFAASCLELALNEDYGQPPQAHRFICGGEEIYRLGLQTAERLYVTRIDHEFDGDIRFPDIDPNSWWMHDWKAVYPDARNAFPFTFQTWLRKNETDAAYYI